MKKRNGFVSNSSSSSFILKVYNKEQDLEKKINDTEWIKEKILNPNQKFKLSIKYYDDKITNKSIANFLATGIGTNQCYSNLDYVSENDFKLKVLQKNRIEYIIKKYIILDIDKFLFNQNSIKEVRKLYDHQFDNQGMIEHLDIFKKLIKIDQTIENLFSDKISRLDYINQLTLEFTNNSLKNYNEFFDLTSELEDYDGEEYSQANINYFVKQMLLFYKVLDELEIKYERKDFNKKDLKKLKNKNILDDYLIYINKFLYDEIDRINDILNSIIDIVFKSYIDLIYNYITKKYDYVTFYVQGQGNGFVNNESEFLYGTNFEFMLNRYTRLVRDINEDIFGDIDIWVKYEFKFIDNLIESDKIDDIKKLVRSL